MSTILTQCDGDGKFTLSTFTTFESQMGGAVIDRTHLNKQLNFCIFGCVKSVGREKWIIFFVISISVCIKLHSTRITLHAPALYIQCTSDQQCGRFTGKKLKKKKRTLLNVSHMNLPGCLKYLIIIYLKLRFQFCIRFAVAKISTGFSFWLQNKSICFANVETQVHIFSRWDFISLWCMAAWHTLYSVFVYTIYTIHWVRRRCLLGWINVKFSFAIFVMHNWSPHNGKRLCLQTNCHDSCLENIIIIGINTTRIHRCTIFRKPTIDIITTKWSKTQQEWSDRRDVVKMSRHPFVHQPILSAFDSLIYRHVFNFRNSYYYFVWLYFIH